MKKHIEERKTMTKKAFRERMKRNRSDVAIGQKLGEVEFGSPKDYDRRREKRLAREEMNLYEREEG